ncbi:MAG: hypothetical protein WCI48_12600 [Bacteroidota bacterium]
MEFSIDSTKLLSAIKKPLVWISIILAILLIGAIVLERILHDESRNKIIRNQAALISSFKYAAVKIDTIHDTIRLPGQFIIKPIPVKTLIHDTILVPNRECWYDSIFSQTGIRFRWQAKGDLQSITFSDFTWPKDIITITRQVDTCITRPIPKQPLFRIGPYVGISLNSFQTFPGLEAGAQLVIKDQLNISAGGLYLNGFYGNLRLGWLFK